MGVFDVVYNLKPLNYPDRLKQVLRVLDVVERIKKKNPSLTKHILL